VPRPGGAILAGGRYVYAGNARGPGGMMARIRRHLRRDKGVRWHIDHLTTRHPVVAVALLPGGDECAVVAALGRRPGVTVPAPDFGSSDCAACPAHLLRLPDDADALAWLHGLADAWGGTVFSPPSRRGRRGRA
jgi:Uri superfamily endonuclease